jgi:hypothetical protein
MENVPAVAAHPMSLRSHRKQARALAAVCVVLALLGIVALIGLGIYLSRTTSVRSNWPLPLADRLAFPAHAAIGTALNLAHTSPRAAAIQWIKASAHARSPAETERAALGLAEAARRAGTNEPMERVLCPDVLGGRSPQQLAAVEKAGLKCDSDEFNLGHVPVGNEIAYQNRPPIAGPHYGLMHPDYGISDEPIAPGYWVHNLEHGAVVLLYRCVEPCPELVGQLRELYKSLPPGRNARSGSGRILATPYPDMDHLIAVIAWGRILELDQFEPNRILAFYEAWIDRGPECRELRCPE